jgi:uncharacterized oligopeptide transporter (OPT) family protein
MRLVVTILVVTVPVAEAVAKAFGIDLKTGEFRGRVARRQQVSREIDHCRCAGVKDVRNSSRLKFSSKR